MNGSKILDVLPKRFLIERVRNSDENPCSVTRVVVCGACSPMYHSTAQLLGVVDDPVRSPPVDVYDEAHPAGVLLQGGVIQTFGFGELPALLVERHFCQYD